MIFLVRHGQTEFNAERRMQGRRDSPLTPLGVEQARRMGACLRDFVEDPDEVELIASPLGRTVRTAEIIRETAGLDCQIVTDERLVEVSVGAWEGLTREQIAPLAPPGVIDAPGWLCRAPGGERFEALVARLSSFLADVDEADGRRRLVVSHGGSGRVLRALYAQAPHEHVWLGDWPPQDAVFRLHGGVVGRVDEGAEADA